jgi:hypothetical protein
MDAWWWIPVGLIAWLAVAVAVGLLLGPVLRSCSQAREALGQQMGEPARLEGLSQDWRRAA